MIGWLIGAFILELFWREKGDRDASHGAVPARARGAARAHRAHRTGGARGTLVSHARTEEEVLYPEWAKLVGFDDAAVPMVHDHEAIVARVERHEQTDVDDIDTPQELLYGLYALISVHFRKEEDIQLPAFDAAPPEVTQAVLERMGALAGQAHEH